MRQQTGILETALALVVALIVMMSLGYVFVKGFGQPRQGHTFYAEFDAVGGLAIGSAVKINGATVGQVKSIDINPQKSYTVMVQFSLRKDLDVPEDSSMAIASDSLLGQPALTLTPGVQTKMLSAGGIIYNTTPPMSLTDLLERAFFGSKTDEGKTDEGRGDDAGSKDEHRDEGKGEGRDEHRDHGKDDLRSGRDEMRPSSDAAMAMVSFA